MTDHADDAAVGEPDAPERVLVVEDLASQAELARLFLAGLGYEVRVASTGAAALDIAREWEPDGLLLDIELPDFNGLDLLARLHEAGSDAVIVVVTAGGSMEMAKNAIRAGAEDYVVKPYNKDRLSVTLRNGLRRRRLARSRRALETQLSETRNRLQDAETRLGETRRDTQGFVNFVGSSQQMRAVYDIIRSVAPSKASVFITGESGTGKELAAEALHKASPRAGKPFIALNCGAIPRDLLESEVFGHVKGAFTGATSDRVGAAKLADGGTLFLDEIGEMPLEMQVKLLRFVQTGTFGAVGSSRLERVDVRFVCATNRDPMLEVQAGRFREDLYYRLYVVPVQLPPLRERGDDVLLVARHFLTQFSREERRRFTGFAPEAERMLMAFSWPGNVRQLQNVVRNIVVLHDGPLVTAAMIPPPVNRAVLTSAQAVLPTPPSTPLIDAGPPAPPAAPPPRDHPGMMATPVQLPQSMAVPEAAPEAPPPPPVEPPPPPGPALSRTPLPHPAASHPAASHPAASHPGASRPAAVPDLEVIPLSEMERRMVLAALARTGNDIPRAAALLEVNPSTIYRKVSAWRKGGLLPS